MIKKFFFLSPLLLSYCLCLQVIGTEQGVALDEKDDKKFPEIGEQQTLSISEPDKITIVGDAVVNNPEETFTHEKKCPEICEEDGVDSPNPALSEGKKQDNSQLFNISEETSCGKGPRPYYLSIRHIEANGVGYNQGYTTFEGFFRNPNPDTWIPFLDVRYHFFNNGKPAANAGIGLRYLNDTRVWGINGYYDYRKTNHQHYNQVSLGLESLGKIWDLRLNGYLPLGKKMSGLFSPRFGEFKNHYLYIQQKYEFAMKGVNAEVGAHVTCYPNMPFYFAAGPYYLEGEGKVAWGGQARGSVDLFGCLRVEGSTSYDNIFKWIGQAQVSLIIPFGGKKTIRPKKERFCKEQHTIAHRALQRVDRFEIISVDRKRKQSKAIDPLTGQPYFFWFVNNQSHSDGTFESPFPTLAMAETASFPHDVIYVYPGDGTSNGMDGGIVLKDDQKLLGAGIHQLLPTTWGKITIPTLAAGFPKITNLLSAITIRSVNNNEISGINLISTDYGVLCFDIINTYIHNNIIDFPYSGGDGLYLGNCSGQITCKENQFNFSGTTDHSGIDIFVSSPQTTKYIITNNVFTNTSLVSGIEGISISGNDNMGEVNISENQFTHMSSQSVFGTFSGTVTLNITANTFSQNSTGPNIGDINIYVNNRGSIITHLTNNRWLNTVTPTHPSIFIKNATSNSNTCATLQDNISGSNPAYELTNNNSSPNSFIADIKGNSGTILETGIGSITPGICP